MKNLLNISIAWMFLIGLVGSAYAQEPIRTPKKTDVSIGNAMISRDDKDLVVDYQILFGDKVLSCNVEVIMMVGDKPVVLEDNELTGDFGKMTEPGQKQFRYNVEKKKMQLAGKDIRFTLNVRGKKVLDDEILAMASAGIHPGVQPYHKSGGLMLGYVKKFGGYVKFRSDFNKNKPSYMCDSNGSISGDGFFWANGSADNMTRTRMQITGGALIRFASWCYPYIGAGYGTRSVLWKDNMGKWAEVSDYSYKGITAEAGLILKMGPVAISAGYSTTAFKYAEIELGVGVMF